MDKKLLELYSDYLLCSFGATTATGLSALLEGRISHDRVTRFLSQADYNGKTLWRQVKGMIRDIEQDDGVLIFDDTIQEKPYTDENDLICWHYDHSQNRTVKGINLLNCVYHASDVSLPVTYELITKPVLYTDVKTRRVKRKSLVTKNDLMRDMLSVCKRNRIKYRYVLADSWFSAKENLQFIRNSLDKHFVVAIKSNRTVALSYEDKRDGRFARIDAQNLTEDTPVQAWIKGLDFPVLLIRQVFTNKDESTGEMFLACSDLTCDGETIETIYQKRWKVETFHKTLKSNAALSKSPTRRVRTQSNHCFMAIYAAAQLEGLRVKHHLNHFALRSRLYLKAIRYAFSILKLRVSKNNCRVFLDISQNEKSKNKIIFGLLKKTKQQIEDEFGGPLEWDPRDKHRACHIGIASKGNVFDRDQWGKMIAFMTDAMFRLERAIKKPLKQAVDQVKNDSPE